MMAPTSEQRHHIVEAEKYPADPPMVARLSESRAIYSRSSNDNVGRVTPADPPMVTQLSESRAISSRSSNENVGRAQQAGGSRG